MNIKLYFSTGLMLVSFGFRVLAQTEKPVVSDNLVFEEQNGLVAVEAELFYNQSKSEIRQWYITSPGNLPTVAPNPDPDHIKGSSNNAYIEILPDTRVTDKDKLISGENFSNEPGKMAVVHNKIKINNPGLYYVWVRCYSSGAEDNGLHVGLMIPGPTTVNVCNGAKVKTNGHGQANNERKKNIVVYQKKFISTLIKPEFTIFSLVCVKMVLKWTNLLCPKTSTIFLKVKVWE